MKQPINEIKRMQQLAGIIPLHESEQTNYDLVLQIVKSHEDDDVLNDFNNAFQQGQNITKDEFFNFFEQYMDDMGELSDIEKNWKFVESGGDYSVFDDEDGYDEDIADFINNNLDEFIKKVEDPGSEFEIMGDPLVATAGTDDISGIDVSFDKEHLLELFPEGDEYNEVQSVEIANRVIYYNNYL